MAQDLSYELSYIPVVRFESSSYKSVLSVLFSPYIHIITHIYTSVFVQEIVVKGLKHTDYRVEELLCECIWQDWLSTTIAETWEIQISL